MKNELEIVVRGEESCAKLVTKGWSSIVSYTTLAEYELESVSVFATEIHLYLKPMTGGEENGIRTTSKQSNPTRRIHIEQVSDHTK